MNLIQEIKQKANLPELISRNHSLKKIKPNHWVALCPFHEEKTPSFSVNDKSYYCYGCGSKGDVIDWVKHRDKVDTSQAIKTLAGFYDIKQKTNQNNSPLAEKPLRQRLKDCVEKLPVNELSVKIIKDISPEIAGLFYIFASPLEEKTKELELIKKVYKYPDGEIGLMLSVEKYESLINLK